MDSINNTKPFTLRQQELIAVGNLRTQQLKDIVKVALGVEQTEYEAKRHTYIYSLPGAGKTFTTAMTAEENNVQMLQIRGSSSIPSLARRLAHALMCKPDEQVIVWVDDCDTLFMDEESLNVMKGALDEDVNMLSWNKNIAGQIARDLASPDENIRQMGRAMKMFQLPGSPGLDIPTDNVRFIITSNKDLCEPSKIIVPGKKVNKARMHEGALRDRINYHEFLLSAEDSWGWVASVLMQPTFVMGRGIDLTLNDKHLLLDFMYTHWDRLPSTSMRAVKDLVVQMKNNPTNYPTLWAMGLTKETSASNTLTTYSKLF